MGWFSCSAESAIATCDSQNWELLIPRHTEDKLPIHFTFSDLFSATDGFCPGNLLGKGSHGSVYRAQLRRNYTYLVAAVKRTKQPHITDTADNEVDILSRIYHPALVNLIGYALDPTNRKLIVVEYMPNGSLYDLLHCSVKPPGWVKRARFALQIAKALNFLHLLNPPVIHRDIKSSNILIDSKFNSRISDFGLSLRGNVEDVRMRSTPPAGTMGYLDPCYLAPADISTKSDVFSFGILLLEIISGRNAIDLNYSPPSVVEWAAPLIKSGEIPWIYDPRIAPPEDDEALQQMAVLAASCVRSRTANRPFMTEVVARLKAVYKSLKAQSLRCVSFGRRVDRVANQYDYQLLPFDENHTRENFTKSGSKRSGKVSSGKNSEECDLAVIGRSKSTGSGREITSSPLDANSNRAYQRKATLRKSLSTGGKTLAN